MQLEQEHHEMDQRQQQGDQQQEQEQGHRRQRHGHQDAPQEFVPFKRDTESDEQRLRRQVREDEEKGKQQS
jgi:hypothetical protein